MRSKTAKSFFIFSLKSSLNKNNPLENSELFYQKAPLTVGSCNLNCESLVGINTKLIQ
jgi:hypothetical protein